MTLARSLGLECFRLKYFVTNFQVEKAKFLPTKWTDVWLRSKLDLKIACTFSKIQIAVNALRVNQTKITSKNGFIADLLALCLGK